MNRCDLEKLRQEIAFQSSHRLVENVEIFKELPKSVLRSIVKYLKFELYLPNDVIVKAGAAGDCMFFLSAGTVAVLTPTGKEVLLQLLERVFPIFLTP